MGTWGLGPFDNDDASDWVWELENSTDLQACLTTLADPASPEAAIAAAEAVAAAAGQPTINLPPELEAWTHRLTSAPDTRTLEITAHRVRQLTAPDTELTTAWAETDELDQWRTGIDDLLSRLQPPT